VPGVRLFEAADHPPGLVVLAASRRAEQRVELAAFDLEREVVDGRPTLVETSWSPPRGGRRRSYPLRRRQSRHLRSLFASVKPTAHAEAEARSLVEVSCPSRIPAWPAAGRGNVLGRDDIGNRCAPGASARAGGAGRRRAAQRVRRIGPAAITTVARLVPPELISSATGLGIAGRVPRRGSGLGVEPQPERVGDADHLQEHRPRRGAR